MGSYEMRELTVMKWPGLLLKREEKRGIGEGEGRKSEFCFSSLRLIDGGSWPLKG